MKIKIKKLRPDAHLPMYAHEGDVGMDLVSVDAGILQPGESRFFYCGFSLEFPNGFAAIVKDRSSMAKRGLHTMAGVFDAGYRGEYNVLLLNTASEPREINIGDKIAQLVICPVEIVELEEVEEMSESSRSTGRFGSTGKNIYDH